MFGLSKSKKDARPKSSRSSRRSSDASDDAGDVEAAVLKALHAAARRSSPHKAAVRAGIARAIGIIETATLGLCHIKDLINEAEVLCRSGIGTEDTTKRALLADRYREVIVELDAIAEATGHGGVQLINDSGNTFEVHLGRSENFKMKLPHINLTAGAKGLALPKGARAFASTKSLEHLKGHLALVQDRLDRSATIFQEHGGELSKHLALVLEHAIPDEEELHDVPQSPETRWASPV